MNRLDELVKCRDSFEYFCTEYVKVSHPTQGLLPFTLFDFQKRLVKCIEEHNAVAVIKFRQGGFSTLSLIYGFWQAMFHGKQVGFRCKMGREMLAFSDFLRRMVKTFPDWFMSGVWMTHSDIKFDLTGGCLDLAKLKLDWQRGKAYDFFVIDEAAFIENMREKWRDVYPGIKGKVLVTSSTNGVGNWFEETVHDARLGKNNFHVFETDYSEHPYYNEPGVLDRLKENLGERGFRKKVLCEFIC